jgi:hypothetical protein
VSKETYYIVKRDLLGTLRSPLALVGRGAILSY